MTLRAALLLVTMALALPAARADVLDPACGLEEFLLGWSEACDELRDPTRLARATTCLWTDAECPPLFDVALADEWGTYYVSLVPLGVFRETNACAGFQPHAGPCGEADQALLAAPL